MSLPSPTPLRKKSKMIPEDEIRFWITKNVDTSDINVVKIRDAYLWTKGDIERHRIDIFEKYEVEGEGEFCWTNKIGERSYFLHYNTSSKTITDKTLGRVEQKQSLKSGLQGIAKGGERIGKSFR